MKTAAELDLNHARRVSEFPQPMALRASRETPSVLFHCLSPANASSARRHQTGTPFHEPVMKIVAIFLTIFTRHIAATVKANAASIYSDSIVFSKIVDVINAIVIGIEPKFIAAIGKIKTGILSRVSHVGSEDGYCRKKCRDKKLVHSCDVSLPEDNYRLQFNNCNFNGLYWSSWSMPKSEQAEMLPTSLHPVIRGQRVARPIRRYQCESQQKRFQSGFRKGARSLRLRADPSYFRLRLFGTPKKRFFLDRQLPASFEKSPEHRQFSWPDNITSHPKHAALQAAFHSISLSFTAREDEVRHNYE